MEHWFLIVCNRSFIKRKNVRVTQILNCSKQVKTIWPTRVDAPGGNQLAFSLSNVWCKISKTRVSNKFQRDPNALYCLSQMLNKVTTAVGEGEHSNQPRLPVKASEQYPKTRKRANPLPSYLHLAPLTPEELSKIITTRTLISSPSIGYEISVTCFCTWLAAGTEKFSYSFRRRFRLCWTTGKAQTKTTIAQNCTIFPRWL